MACIVVVSKTGILTSSYFINKGISVHPSTTPSAPLNAKLFIIFIYFFFESSFIIPLHNSL